MKRFILLILTLLLVFVAYLLYHTLTFNSRQVEIQAIEKKAIDNQAILHLSQALQIQTISYENPEKFDSAQFRAFNKFLQEAYPLVNSTLEKHLFNEFSHLYRWEGKDPSLAPVILMGHLDVVPIASPKKWARPPFSGLIENGVIWGRGAIDDKISVIGIMEGVEQLLSEGFQPQRTFYLAFGHDEEIGGELGAKAIVAHLKKEGVQASFIMDEGFAITQGLVPGLTKDVAMIGVAEKGYTSIELTVDMEGGHSSMPAKETAVDVMAGAIKRLKDNPLKAKISPPLQGFIDYLGPEMPFGQKAVFANVNVFKPIIFGIYEKTGSGNALIRTTTAPTIFEAGIKDNVIPTSAKAIVNFRVLPGETAAEVLAHVVNTIGDERVSAQFFGFSSEPSPVSSTESFGFETINKTIKEIFPNTLTTPNLVIGATDARHYTDISTDIYRFVPYHINEKNINAFHGVNENITVENYKNAIRFYRQLIKNTDQ